MKIRVAKREELLPKKRERALSPRQQAALKREEEIRRSFSRLKSEDDVVAIELDPNEKVPTLRQAVKKAIASHRPDVQMAIRGSTIYLSTGKLPGRRGGGRRPKAARA
jgi:hypothetical protein